MREKLKKVISDWYEGRTVISKPPILGVFQERHWTAQWVHAAVEFHRKEWKWAIPVYLTVVSWLLIS